MHRVSLVCGEEDEWGCRCGVSISELVRRGLDLMGWLGEADSVCRSIRILGVS